MSKYKKTNKRLFAMCLFLVCTVTFFVLTLCFMNSQETSTVLPLYVVFSMCFVASFLGYFITLFVSLAKKDDGANFVISLESTLVTVLLLALLPVIFIVWIIELICDKGYEKRHAK